MNGAKVRAYSLAKDGNKQLADHFQVKEFRCRDNTDTVFVSAELVHILEQIRVHFGKAVNVNSGYRTEAHNKAEGGSPNSQHKYGMAADVAIKSVAPKDIAAYAEKLLPGRGGIGIYKNFVHIDVRANKSRWNG